MMGPDRDLAESASMLVWVREEKEKVFHGTNAVSPSFGVVVCVDDGWLGSLAHALSSEISRVFSKRATTSFS